MSRVVQVRDIIAGVLATLLMYIVPYTVLGGTSSWILYIYWVVVASSYTCYALYRFSRILMRGGSSGA